MIESFDLGVFRRVLHVAVSPTLEELQERFRFALNSDDCEDKYAELDESVYNSFLKGHEAFVIRVVDKKDNLYGYLFHLDGNGCGNMSDFIDTITHESGHVMDDIFEDLGIKDIDSEMSSLLSGYIAGKVYKTFEGMEEKIGVGVITCGNRKMHEYGSDVGIFTDTEKKGAAYSKNRLIKQFYDEGKEHIFIFDDDAYPVISGWKEKIINWCERNNVHYLGGIDLKNAQILSAEKDVLQISSAYIGAFYYMDRECIEKVGYYNQNYGRYGWEDVEYSIRVNYCFGLNNSYPYPSWMNMYLHSEDMFEENPIPNMDADEKMRYIKDGEVECNRMCDEAKKGNWYIGYDGES